jgi:hypothetical protein
MGAARKPTSWTNHSWDILRFFSIFPKLPIHYQLSRQQFNSSGRLPPEVDAELLAAFSECAGSVGTAPLTEVVGATRALLR